MWIQILYQCAILAAGGAFVIIALRDLCAGSQALMQVSESQRD